MYLRLGNVGLCLFKHIPRILRVPNYCAFTFKITHTGQRDVAAMTGKGSPLSCVIV